MKERARRALAWLHARVVDNIELRDVFCFGGIAAVGYGLSLIYPPAAWIVCGAVIFWLGVR